LRCLFLLARHHGISVPAYKLALVEKQDAVEAIVPLMRDVGLDGQMVDKAHWRDLATLGSAFPVMAEYNSGAWVILINIAPEEKIAVLDPMNEMAGVTLIPRHEIEAQWTGRMVLCKRTVADDKEEGPQKFGFSWFMPEILRNARSFRDIAILTVLSTLISLASPVMFNLLIDKVVPHHSYNTLYAVIVAFGVIVVFDTIFRYVRSYLTMYAGNKIDARLASTSFAKMLRLPMDFFEHQPAGVLLRNLQQTEQIRGFLTGRLFMTGLDLVTLPVLIVFLCLYSVMLTGIVLVFALAMAAMAAGLVPLFKRKLGAMYQAEGDRQADLVETLHGMRAIKSLALETLRQSSWDAKVARSVRMRTSVTHFNIVATTVTGFLGQIMSFTVLALGVSQVFNGHLSLGGLVAFNMLSSRVSGPLLQLVGLINEYQQVALSVRMLGTLMDHPPERDPAQRGISPVITGELSFKSVTFRYEGSVVPALDRISFDVHEGQVIGVVGRSGSGKTTLTRLIQGLHPAQAGLIQLNGTDIRHLDLNHLRRSIGVVLQDSVLFRGTIRDNIAAANPEASLEEVMNVARLAGAEEFIARLPHSYETRVEESATNFSGGQRQRIAIARALLLKPKLLLFDEATSALDPESEAIIQQNLSEIAAGRTMIIVSHRLASLVGADAILVLERGQVVDFAPHSVLLDRCEIYRHLWSQQTRFVQ
jgi:ATP-binding cassette subfamily B protein